MLNADEQREIDLEIQKFEVKQAACIEALMILQHHRGYVDNEAVLDVANYLHMSSEEVDSIATFYNLIYRKPVGRHVIRLCDSISCYIMGYERVLAKLKEHLGISFGETTKDGRFTLLPAQCLGTCDRAPALMIDEKLYTQLGPEQTIEMINNYQTQVKRHGTSPDT